MVCVLERDRESVCVCQSQSPKSVCVCVCVDGRKGEQRLEEQRYATITQKKLCVKEPPLLATASLLPSRLPPSEDHDIV